MVSIEELTKFCKEKGLVFASAELYGGLAGFWDFGHLGVELKNNIKSGLWKSFVSQRDDVEILLVGPGNFFLEKALAAYPKLRLDRQLFYAGGGNHDIVIFDQVAVPELDRGNFFLIGELSPTLPWREVGVQQTPTVTGWDPEHPILRSVDLSDLFIRSASEIETSREGRILATSGDNPLLASYETPDLRVVYLGFDIMASDFPLRVSFPIMLGNILSWLYEGALPSATRQVRSGEPFFFPIEANSESVAVIGPDNRTTLINNPEILTGFTGTSSVGWYRVIGAAGMSSFAVNLLDEGESNINPRFQPPETAPLAAGISIEAKMKWPLWPLLLGAGLLLVLGEWLFWVKRW